ncbi:MAG: hypothetical protein NUV51_08350 [Sulfuricaulis sp.]|nr:hypothetical protein [Sulfuricaulis sp.]
MSGLPLARALRDVATGARDVAYDIQRAIDDGPVTPDQEKALSHANARTLKLASELVRVLANVVDGMDVRKALGAPGDWGYETPIGDGIVQLLNSGAAGAAVSAERSPTETPHPLLSATHYCKDCGALWRQCDDFSFNLRAAGCCEACNNEHSATQLVQLTEARAERDALATEMQSLLPGYYYMDPPDGGDVSISEQLRRMGKDAERYRRLRNGSREPRAIDSAIDKKSTLE